MKNDNIDNVKENKLLKIIRIIVGLPFSLIFFLAGIVFLVEFVQTLFAFVEMKVFPAAYVLENLCIAMILMLPAVGIFAFAFPKILPGIKGGKITALTFVFVFGAVAFSITDTNQTMDFPWRDYPPYIEKYQTKVLYRTEKCDYTDTIIFDGYLNFINNGFKVKEVVEIVEDVSLTDSYRIEVRYKGGDARLDIYEYNGEHGINVYLKNYDYDIRPYDVAYMYKYKINLEYAVPLAVEKIIIRTAYPEKINTQKLYSY